RRLTAHSSEGGDRHPMHRVLTATARTIHPSRCSSACSRRLAMARPSVAAVLLAITGCALLLRPARSGPRALGPTFGVDPVLGPGPYGPGIVVSDRREGYAYARGLTLTDDGKIVFALGGTIFVERRLSDGLPDDSFGTHGVVGAGFFNLSDVAI